MNETAVIQVSTPLTRSRALSYLELGKPRILSLVLAATCVGFYVSLPAAPVTATLPLLLHTLLGTALVAYSANALNQYLEVGWDARMTRTAHRPLPSGRLTLNEALWFGVSTGILGAVYLTLFAHPFAALFACLSLFTYVFAYTPLKRVTTFSVFVGAVSGALPPVIGGAAASGSFDSASWLLFCVLFFWQLPHFATIAWLYREDYGRAGYRMMPVVDQFGLRTDVHLITHTITLMVASLLPVVYGAAGVIYAAGAALFGLAFLVCGGLFVRHKSDRSARRHVFSSILYLPILLATLLLDRALAL